MGRLDGKVAIVTGGASGLGKATSLLWAKEGAKVVITDCIVHEDGEAAVEAMVKEIKGAGSEATFVRADVSKTADAQKMVKTAVDTYGKLNVLFNNAGIAGPTGLDIADWPEEEADRVIAVNFKGVYLGMKYAIPEMLKAGGGSIISTASICAFNCCQGQGIYSATKGAVVSLSRTVACEYARRGIRCNTVNPAPARSQLFADSKIKADARQRTFLADQIPMGRICEPDDVAYAALFLASDESKYITGTDLMVDGGWRVRGYLKLN